MRIAVLSGKGGAGKTFLAANLAASIDRAVYVDCDVEEPNGHLFFKPQPVASGIVSQIIPSFDAAKCSGCRKCVDFCKFNALLYIQKKPMLFTEVCHSCGGCMLVCPEQAIQETARPIGCWEKGISGHTSVITGTLNPGEASGIGVIQAALEAAGEEDAVIIDCPPGSACSVQESIASADFCLLAAEPTAFGFHNFQMVYELVRLHGKPCGVVINKENVPYSPLEDFCREHRIPILMRIPDRKDYGSWLSQGELVCNRDPALKTALRDLYRRIGGGAQ